MAKIVKTALVALALLALQASPSRAEVVNGIAATVNDDVITRLDVEKEFLQLQRETEKLPASEKMGLKNTALNRLIDKKLIDQKIRELDIKVSDDEVKAAIDDVRKQNHMTEEALKRALASQGLSYNSYKGQIKEQLERMRLMGQEVKAKLQVGEREVREYYDANRAKFGADQTFHARHIFFKVDKNATQEEVEKKHAKADEVLREVRAPGADFSDLAKKYSDDPAAAKDGGDLGTFKKSEMLPEIGETVSAMRPGEVSNVVRSPAGFHIIKLEEKGEGGARPFDEVKGDIEELLYKKKADERLAQWAKEMRASAAIDIK